MSEKQKLELYTVPEVAKMLRVSYSLIYKLARKGVFPHYKIGTRFLFDFDGIKQFAAKSKRKMEMENSNFKQ